MLKKAHIFFATLIGFVFFALVPFGSAQEGEVIESVRIEGNKRIDESTILYYIKSKSGTVLSKKQIREDIEQIYSLGQFKDIRVETREALKGLEVEFFVEEIPSIGDVEIVGNDKIDANDIREKIGLKRGATFNDHMILESSEEILKLYREKGYFFAQANIDTQPVQGNLVNVSIRIKEGEKVKIEKIRFSGNKSFPDKDLQEQMETQEKTWYSFVDDSGVYQKDILKLDMFRIEGFYHDNGYLRVKVLEPRIDINKKAKQVHITVPVEEGPQFRVKSLALKSDDVVSSDEIQKSIQTKMGDIYNVSQLRQDILTIADLYSKKGYAYADANPISKLNDDDRTVELSIEVDKGKKVYVGSIEILGNLQTRDNVIRREFRLKEGELFDGSKLKRSKQRINNLNFFEDVKIDTHRGQDPDLIDILTTVTEKPSGSFSIGAGFSSVENLIFTTSIAQNNLFGNGQRLNLNAQLSSIRADFNLSFTEPRLLDSEILLGIDAFNRDQDFLSFNSQSTGGGFRLGKNISEYDLLSFRYRLENVDVSGLSADSETAFFKNGTRVTSRVAPTFVHDSRDNFLNPSKGWRHMVGFELAGLGGAKFSKSVYEVTYYRPIVGKLVGAAHGRVNYGDGYGGEKLPGFERYFMGGPTSLRGFTIQDIGPKDSRGNPVGGSQSLLVNLEVQYPFTKSFRGFLFYDRGNVYGTGFNTNTTAKNFDLGEMRSSVGAGIRFISPFGPLGFAYGFKLDQQTGEEAAQFHFSAGSAF
ncbi:MAG: outer membrane protein assembly factor BamA [Nitrospinae bacterium]|nr:outer membrane protein assembly factor BamA [Nitrospinota bacterium]MBL7020732.1 outer membrane protein assembly factor BamA [Nitrospinaceae bacterium]